MVAPDDQYMDGRDDVPAIPDSIVHVAPSTSLSSKEVALAMEEDDDRRNLFDMANSLIVGGPTGTVSIGAVDYTTMDTTVIQTALRSVVFRGGAKSYRTRALRSVCLYVDRLRQSAVSKIKKRTLFRKM